MNVPSTFKNWRSWAFRALGRRAWDRFAAATRDPGRAQEALLSRLLEANATSLFGREHSFASLRNWEDYRSAVPIGDYERFRPYVNRMVAGETTALTADPPYMLTQTSGTTGIPKLIPVTRAQRTAGAAATRVWFYRALLDHPRLFDGRILAMVSPAIEGYTEGGLPYGSASGHIYQNAPWAIRHLYALPYQVAEIKDYEARYYVAMRLALEQSISFIGTPNPSTIGRLMETVDSHAEQLIRDIHEGTLSPAIEVSSATRRTLADRLAPNPRRARALTEMASVAGAPRLTDYWPDLQLVGCWKGGSVGVQLEKLARWFPPSVPFRDIGYLASEANMAIPIGDTGAGGVLAVDANVYEFVPEDAIEEAEPPVLRCDELI
ncbi:MAG TPA: GH3 auxin-responsive promoter family protein, partial [Chloroflexota bacterium]